MAEGLVELRFQLYSFYRFVTFCHRSVRRVYIVRYLELQVQHNHSNSLLLGPCGVRLLLCFTHQGPTYAQKD